jgi:Rps23 Pro-64 3,4-dihydroxylase Tpa1-like proline 4-hydroxylase
MKKIFDEDHLMALADQYKGQYQSNQPFPYIVIDNFMDPAVLQPALDSFPKQHELDFYKYDNVLEKKLAMDQVAKLPDPIADVLLAMNSALFLRFLENLTGIDGLIADPYYRGGGIHQIVPGGKLDVHLDFNFHQKLRLDRRLNALIYLNQNWKEEYGGYFEIWKGHRDNDGKHVLESCEKKVLPLFNRFVVFSTSEHSYHGHPDPLTCPDGWTRKSIATYYYTNGRPEEEKVSAHSTTFIARPQDAQDTETEKLRELRNQGRLASNVASKIVS